jgi:hypothetical protein
MNESIFFASSCRRRCGLSAAVNAIAMAFLLCLWPGELAAQGLPVDTGSHIPVALWFIDAGVLGVVMVYGILHNRKRTRAEVQRTEQATRDLYKEEQRDRVRSGGDL